MEASIQPIQVSRPPLLRTTDDMGPTEPAPHRLRFGDGHSAVTLCIPEDSWVSFCEAMDSVLHRPGTYPTRHPDETH